MEAELAALETETELPGPAQFTLNFLWLDKNVAVSVDQLFDQVKGLHEQNSGTLIQLIVPMPPQNIAWPPVNSVISLQLLRFGEAHCALCPLYHAC